VDDPDGSLIYDDVLKWIRQNASALSDDITVMRLGPSDQVLNTLLSNAAVVLQLSEREGFEVKVSEAIHKGKPIIATRAGGIPLQVEDQVNGFLVEVGDVKSVAYHLLQLWTDSDLYGRISSSHSSFRVSDEVSTVGQALNWFYLSSLLSQNMAPKPNGRWIHDLARESLGQVYTKEDGKLKRVVGENILSSKV
jgi:glycosyltransferase involved in cell wall biosynthesis